MGVAAAYYTVFGEALRSLGVHVIISDLRGIGSSSLRASRACDFGYREILAHDLPALVAAVRERFPASPRFLFGHSLGGQLWSLYLSANPGAADGIVNIATCNVHYTGWPRPARYGVLGTALWFRALGETLGYVPAGRFGFAGDEAKTLIEDWSNNCLKGTYVVANDPVDYEGALRALQRPVLSLSLEGDRLAPQQAVDNLVVKMESANVTRRHLSLAELGIKRGSHFSWGKRPAAVVGAIEEWMNRAVKAGEGLQPGRGSDAL
jgi:predicted alpha/beta hydrolase